MHTYTNIHAYTHTYDTCEFTYTWYTLNFVFPRRGANFKSKPSFGSLGYYSSSCGYCKSKPRKTRQFLSFSSVFFSPLHASSLLAASVLASLSHISLPLHLLYSSKFGLGFGLTWHIGWKTQGKTDWLILCPFYLPFRLCDWYYHIGFTAIALPNLSRYWLASVRIDALPTIFFN